jgi:hypothetical protein
MDVSDPNISCAKTNKWIQGNLIGSILSFDFLIRGCYKYFSKIFLHLVTNKQHLLKQIGMTYEIEMFY